MPLFCWCFCKRRRSPTIPWLTEHLSLFYHLFPLFIFGFFLPLSYLSFLRVYPSLFHSLVVAVATPSRLRPNLSNSLNFSATSAVSPIVSLKRSYILYCLSGVGSCRLSHKFAARVSGRWR
ncbi:hypothetical protein BDW71DRAFT_11605 [Aspergillus fruticulosus]